MDFTQRRPERRPLSLRANLILTVERSESRKRIVVARLALVALSIWPGAKVAGENEKLETVGRSERFVAAGAAGASAADAASASSAPRSTDVLERLRDGRKRVLR